MNFEDMTDEQLKRVAQSELSNHYMEEAAERGYNYRQSQLHRDNYYKAVKELKLRCWNVSQNTETLRLEFTKQEESYVI